VDATIAESLLSSAEEAGAGLRGLHSKAIVQRLDEQYADLKLALQWFIDEQQVMRHFGWRVRF
jgi:hypothetical protein